MMICRARALSLSLLRRNDGLTWRALWKPNAWLWFMCCVVYFSLSSINQEIYHHRLKAAVVAMAVEAADLGFGCWLAECQADLSSVAKIY